MMTRTAFGFTGHWMWSGIVGAGLIYLIGRPAERRNVGLGLTLMITPMTGHGVWDAAGTIAGEAGHAALRRLTAAAGRHKVRRHYIKSKQGHHAERAAKHVVEAIHDLADAVAVSKGADAPDVDHARAEIARLRG